MGVGVERERFARVPQLGGQIGDGNALGAVSASQEAMDGFARVTAGAISPAEFFSDENVGRILAAVAA